MASDEFMPSLPLFFLLLLRLKFFFMVDALWMVLGKYTKEEDRRHRVCFAFEVDSVQLNNQECFDENEHRKGKKDLDFV